jgi:hypothetical protein
MTFFYIQTLPQARHLVDLILNCYQQRYRNRRRQQQQQQQQMNNGTDEPLLGPKLEDVKEEDTKEDIKEPGGELGGMGSGLVECETLLTVEQETILFSADYNSFAFFKCCFLNRL